MTMSTAPNGSERRLRDALPTAGLIDFTYSRRAKAEKRALREAFDAEFRVDFLKHLAQSRSSELRASGFSPQNIASLARGRVPRGYQVHHIRPLDDGGTNDPSNLVLIRAHPEHEAIHRFLDPQLQDLRRGQSRIVKLPVVAPGFNKAPPLRHHIPERRGR
jgi:hypothetical protein